MTGLLKREGNPKPSEGTLEIRVPAGEPKTEPPSRSGPPRTDDRPQAAAGETEGR